MAKTPSLKASSLAVFEASFRFFMTWGWLHLLGKYFGLNAKLIKYSPAHA